MEELIYEVYGSLPRQGPGDDASTGRALALMTELPENARILEIRRYWEADDAQFFRSRRPDRVCLPVSQPVWHILRTELRCN